MRSLAKSLGGSCHRPASQILRHPLFRRQNWHHIPVAFLAHSPSITQVPPGSSASTTHTFAPWVADILGRTHTARTCTQHNEIIIIVVAHRQHMELSDQFQEVKTDIFPLACHGCPYSPIHKKWRQVTKQLGKDFCRASGPCALYVRRLILLVIYVKAPYS